MTFQALALRQTIHSFYQRQPPRNETKCFDVFAKVAKISKNIPFENVKDYFYLVAKLLAAVLEKKYVAVWQRSTKTRRTVWFSRTHISPKIIIGCPWMNQQESTEELSIPKRMSKGLEKPTKDATRKDEDENERFLKAQQSKSSNS